MREVLDEGPATIDEIFARVWHLYPAGRCVAQYRYDLQRLRSKRASSKAGYSCDVEEQQRRGARSLIHKNLYNWVRYGTVVKEGDTYRLV